MSEEPIFEETFNENLNIDEKVKEGGILANLYIEVQGNNKEVAEKALKIMVYDRLLKEPNIYVLEVKFYDIRKYAKSEHFSGVVEVKLLAKDFRWFLSAIMRYAPSAIEIIEPDKVTLSLDEMHAIVADVAEMTQYYSSQILNLLKDEERLKLYEKILKASSE